VAAAGEAARAAALELVQASLRRRRPLDEAIAAAMQPGGRLFTLEARDRGFARAIAAATLRRLGQIDAALVRLIERPLPPKAAFVQDALRIAAAQLLFMGVKPHAAVDAAVRQAARAPEYKGLVNAVLRRLELPADAGERLNCPDWLWASWRDAYGEDAAARIVATLLEEPPLDIVAKEPGWAERLDAETLPTGVLRRRGGGAVEALPGFAEGAWWVQDAAASLPARLFGEVAGRRVLDLCAAPGGKTLQLAAMGAEVAALDISEKRLALVRENLERPRLSAELIAADAAQWRPAAAVPVVLLDAPCTATGTIRRHPDVWRLTSPEDVARLSAVQDRLLRAAVEMTEPGGVLVYCACSLEPVEGPARIAALLEGGAPVARRPIEPAEVGGLAELITPEGDLRTLPCHLAERGGMDGFYACRLVRLPESGQAVT
jgi:16S rRNA (cytosine967-C5)-methyltransferase